MKRKLSMRPLTLFSLKGFENVEDLVFFSQIEFLKKAIKPEVFKPVKDTQKGVEGKN